MNSDRTIGTLLTALIMSVLAVGNAFSATMMEMARKQSWEIQNLEPLAALFSNKSSVNSFVQEVYALQYNVVVQPSLCEYELADLNNDGMVELITTLNDGGRFCNTILVVQNINGTLKASKLYGDGSITDLKSRIVDLNHDGLTQVLVPRFLAPYDGANPIPVIDDVYKWDGTKLRKADTCFKAYYRSVLPILQSKLLAVRQGQKLDFPEHKGLLEKKYETEIEEVNRILFESNTD